MTSSYTTGASPAGVSVGEGCSRLFPFECLISPVATWLYEDSTPAMKKNSNQDSKEEERKRADDTSKNQLAAG